MVCEQCGGYVEWKGKITSLTHTECSSCGGVNCQALDQHQEEMPIGDAAVARYKDEQRAEYEEEMRLDACAGQIVILN